MKNNKKKVILSILLCIVLLATTIIASRATTLLSTTTTSNNIKVHFKNTWTGSPNIYYWNSLPKNIEVKWPGVQMQKEDNNWYSYSFADKTKINMIFNQGTNQTRDLTRTTGEWWYENGSWYSSNPDLKPDNERTDFRDETIYFVMTTRFYDGYLDNNVHCWDDAQAKNPDSDPAWRGDFQGLIDKLDYIKALGFSAIWVTPVVENASGYDYHGYHAINMQRVDPRYESPGATYQDLIDAIHAKGMKIIQDVVFNHTGNFGEETLAPMFDKDFDYDKGVENYTKEDYQKLASIDSMKLKTDTQLPATYATMIPSEQYQTRLALMKDIRDPIVAGQLNDPFNYFHHYGHFNWDFYNSQLGQIAGDCVDVNTENPLAAKYIVDSYSKYIDMGVDSFRIDTAKHISRLTFNNFFNDQFKERGGENFYMFGEVCSRSNEVWYRGTTPPLSAPFYTWKESKEYQWNYYEGETTIKAYEDYKAKGATIKMTDFNNDYVKYIAAREQNELTLPHYNNVLTTETHYNDNMAKEVQPISTNHLLQGNDYHTPDYSMKSGLDVIDFPMHWNFKTAQSAFNVAKGTYDKTLSDSVNATRDGDHLYNDATWNVTYVDSHDYAPDHAPEDQRFAGTQDTWAENLNLMFTFRGIPCIYYGSEIEFMKGAKIDVGPNAPLSTTGRAYFGDNIEGSIDVADFAKYTNATGTMADTLNHPLSKHIQRLNLIRRAVPALRKGQYSTEGITGNMAFKRRYTNTSEGVDSFVCVTITGTATFTGIPNGKYTDAITGDVKTVTNGTLSIPATAKGDMRVYVLDLGGDNKISGQIGEEGKYLN